jgi:hypothetical protein
MFGNAKWVWPTRSFTKNQRANFFFEADISPLKNLRCSFNGPDGTKVAILRNN